MILLPGCPCCGCSCSCGEELPSDGSGSPEVRITYRYRSSGSTFTQDKCVNTMAIPSYYTGTGRAAPQTLRCGVDDPDDTALDLPAVDPTLCYWINYSDGTFIRRLYFNVADCDCETGDGCTWTVAGWDDSTSTYSTFDITAVEILGTSC